MSSDEHEYLEKLMAAYEHDEGPLSDWERGFMKDQKERWEKYAGEMRLSSKQWNVLFRVGKVYDLAQPEVETGK